MNANISREVSRNKTAENYGASQSELPISSNFGQTAGGSGMAFRADLFVGVVAVTSAISAKHQHSNRPGVWTDAKSVSITASTEKNATADSSTDQLSITSHGYVENQAIVISGTTVPGGLESRKIYWVHVIDANTISLKDQNEGVLVDISSNGTSVKTTAVRVFSISYLPTVAGDQAHMPLRSSGRLVLTSGASDSVDLLSIRVNQED